MSDHEIFRSDNAIPGKRREINVRLDLSYSWSELEALIEALARVTGDAGNAVGDRIVRNAKPMVWQARWEDVRAVVALHDQLDGHKRRIESAESATYSRMVEDNVAMARKLAPVMDRDTARRFAADLRKIADAMAEPDEDQA